MPTPEPDTLPAAPPIAPSSSDVTCPIPLTPPPEEESSRNGIERPAVYSNLVEDGIVNNAEEDNTARGMSLAQEYSMYHYQEEDSRNAETVETASQGPKENDAEKISVPHDYLILRNDIRETPFKDSRVIRVDESEAQHVMPSPESMTDASESVENTEEGDLYESSVASRTPTLIESTSSFPQGTAVTPDSLSASYSSSSTPPWDFSSIRLTSQYPSSLLRPGSRFTGTQQSDRQIYNVDVNILTLSIPQSTLTGYLRICGLTEDHPTLTTFFTGEIIGGPNQKYTFQTKHPSWGATDKTDLQHWARFPAWRPLSKDAKRDINFAYPPPATGLGSGGGNPERAEGPGWWQRENIFMRWKEWFLVPDHRVKSIQGASFEGFYYICFNQVEGRISGIYFHARSEK